MSGLDGVIKHEFAGKMVRAFPRCEVLCSPGGGIRQMQRITRLFCLKNVAYKYRLETGL